MLVVVGLGNPGKEYKGSRHNVGFEVVDRVAREYGAEVTRRRFRSRIGEAATEAGPVLLVKPQTYMNDSGRAVQAVVAWNRLELDNLLVVCDDLDLKPGRVRVRRKGSSGGHKGLQSIVAALGTTGFARLRVGIGRPAAMPPIDYVLGRFTAAERTVVADAIERAAEAVRCWAVEGVDACMNRFN